MSYQDEILSKSKLVHADWKEAAAHYNGQFTEACAEVDRLRTENAGLVALHKQAQTRLDWLVANSAYVSHSRDGDVCSVWLSQDPSDDSNGAVPVEGFPQACYIDAGIAIDAARASRTTERP